MATRAAWAPNELVLKSLKELAMFGAATLAGEHSAGKAAPSQDEVAGEILVRSLAVRQEVWRRERGRDVATLIRARMWRRRVVSILAVVVVAFLEEPCVVGFFCLGCVRW